MALSLTYYTVDVVGSSSFVVMDTDYDSSAMVCTCQDMDLFFTYAHRRSCSILQVSRVKTSWQKHWSAQSITDNWLFCFLLP